MSQDSFNRSGEDNSHMKHESLEGLGDNKLLSLILIFNHFKSILYFRKKILQVPSLCPNAKIKYKSGLEIYHS